MRKNKLILVILIVIGAFFRLWHLDDFPPSLNWDEVSLGYNAYSLFLTGRDEWRQPFPLSFWAYGDYKLPGYVYAAVPLASLFPSWPAAVRLPSALAGVTLIPITYVLTSRLFRRFDIALLSSLLVAIEPWSLFLSRVAVEANLATLLIALGISLLLSRRYFLAAVFFGLSVWTYNSARVFVPAFIVLWAICNWRKLRNFNRKIWVSVFTLILFIGPMLWLLASPAGQVRARWLTILDSGTVAQIEDSRNSSPLPPPLARFLYNRPVEFVRRATLNYISYFSPDFLFFQGGNHYQFSVQSHGLLYLVDLPLFYLGLIYLLRQTFVTRDSRLTTVASWLLLAPLPGSLVRDAPHALRAITFLPLAMILSAMGLSLIVQKFKSKIIYIGYGLLIFILFINYGLQALDYRTRFSWSWQYGHQQLVEFLKSRYADFDQIIITKKYAEPHEFILYYWPWDPIAYQTDPHLKRYARSEWFWVDAFAKFRFVNDWELSDYISHLPPTDNYLVVTSPQSSLSYPELTRINFLDNSPAFLIYQI